MDKRRPKPKGQFHITAGDAEQSHVTQAHVWIRHVPTWPSKHSDVGRLQGVEVRPRPVCEYQCVFL